MRSEALDISLEGRGSAIRLILAGPFHREQIPNIRGKFAALLEDGNRDFMVNIEGVTVIDDGVVEMFLTLLSDIRRKGGDLTLIFKNPTVSEAFAPYEKIFAIFPDENTVANRTFLARLKNRGSVLSRITGVRLSRRVALFLLFVLCGWFVSLAFIIHLQSRRISEQEQELLTLRQENHYSLMELARLKERIRPLEQLGVLRDGPPGPARRVVRDTVRKPVQDTVREAVRDTIPPATSDTLKDSLLP